MTATWTAPRTYTAGELLTASIFNSHIRDNLDWLKTPINSGLVTSTSNFTTTSAAFTDVTWATTTFTTNGGGLLLYFRCAVAGSTTTNISFDVMVDGVSESGGNGVYPVDSLSTVARGTGFTHRIAALSAGSHTIKIRTLTSAGTLTVYGSTAGAKPTYFVMEEA